MRAVVVSDQRVGGGALVLNAEFLRFAAHWGFHPRACRPYRAQTKDQASDCTSAGRYGAKWGNRWRIESLRPWCLAGG